MGTYSNIILLGSDRKILGAVKTVDITDATGRAVLPGLVYENPPAQSKLNPLTVKWEEFMSAYESCDAGMTADKFIMKKFMGISSLIAREISFSCTKQTDAPILDAEPEKLWFFISTFADGIKEKRGVIPSLFPLVRYIFSDTCGGRAAKVQR